jgi:hypothetical protein
MLEWGKYRDRFPLIPVVDAKIAFIDGDHDLSRVVLAHSDQAQIGKVRMAIFESSGHGGELIDVSPTLKSNAPHSVPDQRQHVGDRRQVTGRLHQVGFAGQRGRWP